MANRILIAGGSGLVGSELTAFLIKKGHLVRWLSRTPKVYQHIVECFSWNPEDLFIDENALQGVDIIINLTGESIAGGRWTKKRKNSILESRVNSIKTIVNALKRLNHKPKLWINASAIGIYGDQGEKILDEESQFMGTDFLSKTVQKWENYSVEQISPVVERLILSRIGLVVSEKGGFLRKLMSTNKFGATIGFGPGKSYCSWIHIKDLTSIFHFLINNEQSEGVFNITSPNPIKMCDLLSKIHELNPCSKIKITLPAGLIKIILGEMSDVLLSGNYVIPLKLIQYKYNFNIIQIDEAILEIVDSQKI